ncbi:MAG TPA: DUF1552 domain-containing protein [Polyangiaceae bacterium]|nr:DUF1552 domain-containing protein [Polyangiaceae bacterium]
MPPFEIDRRTVLRGTIAGTIVSLALPPLEAMFNANGTALAQGAAIPRRLGIFFWGGGVKQDRWNPVDTGPTYTLSPALQPLQVVKDYVSVVSGMSVKTGSLQGHHSGAVGVLSGCPMVTQPANGAPYRSTFSAPSIDQVAAAAIGKTSKFKSLEVGISKRINGGEGTTLQYLSHNGPDNPNPSEYDPIKVFDRLFGTGVTPPPGTADLTLALRKSVLDGVLADVNRLRMRVSAADKARLDQHLDNVRSIENRLVGTGGTMPPSSSCKLPVKPGAVGGTNSKENLQEATKLMSDLIAMALACDLTRVFSMMYSGPTNSTVFWQVNATTGHHALTHDEAGDQPLVHACTIFTMQCLADLCVALKNIPEGAGNVLDNTAIIGSSDVADGKAHSLTDYPLVVAGKGGGFLKYPGVHYRSANKENTSTVLFSVLRAAGLTMTEFGAGGGLVSTSCTAIEA